MEQVPGSLVEVLPPCAWHAPPSGQRGTGERGVPGLGPYTPSEAVPAPGKGDPNPQLGGPWRSEAAPVHSGPPQGPCTFCELREGLGVQEGSPKGGACCAPPTQKCFGAEDRKQPPLQPFGGTPGGPNLEAGLGRGVGKLGPFPIRSRQRHAYISNPTEERQREAEGRCEGL